MRHWLLFVVLFIWLPLSWAEKRYVSDVLWIQLRSGQGQEYRILKSLKSGTHLEFLEENPETGYTRVKTDKELEGWVPTRFLTNEPIAFEKLILSERALTKAQEELQSLKNQTKQLGSNKSELSQQIQELSQSNSELTKELSYIKEVSANAIDMDQKNAELLEKNQQQQQEIKVLSAEVERLTNVKEKDYMLYSGALVLIGVFLGYVLPLMKRHRRNESW